ncbi:MAG: hypothetical protein M1814_004858 [Vezdaea aestivalis]|nr:MAG: hypothetical protein M1814_004858 [Vezdaea aestivalis]
MRVRKSAIPVLISLSVLTWSAALPSNSQKNNTPVYPGWAEIKYFGDSYTTTDFDINGTQPTLENPLGNPEVSSGFILSMSPSSHIRRTTVQETIDPTYVNYLTTKYNASLVLTYNLASGGATIDSSLVKPYTSTTFSLQDQVQSVYQRYAAGSPPWTKDNALFVILIGINDVGNTYSSPSYPADIQEQIVAAYRKILGQLFSFDAHNFLILNVPPMDRSPATTAFGSQASANERVAIQSFNQKVGDMLKAFAATTPAVWYKYFDFNTIMEHVLDDPKAFVQTASYRDTTTFCDAYLNGTVRSDTSVSGQCKYPVNEYFWHNSLHPTYPMHDVLAQLIAADLVWS